MALAALFAVTLPGAAFAQGGGASGSKAGLEEQARQREYLDSLKALAKKNTFDAAKKLLPELDVKDEATAALERKIADAEEKYQKRCRTLGNQAAKQGGKVYTSDVEALQKLYENLHLPEMYAQINAFGARYRTVVNALSTFTDADAVQHVAEKGLKEKSWRVRRGCAEALGTTKCDAVDIAGSLRGACADADPKVRSAALDSLFLRNAADPPDVFITALQDDFWQVKVSSIFALGKLNVRPAVGPLIEALQTEPGRLREDIDNALKEITGKSFGGEAGPWAKWWTEHSPTWDAETEALKKKAEELAQAPPPPPTEEPKKTPEPAPPGGAPPGGAPPGGTPAPGADDGKTAGGDPPKTEPPPTPPPAEPPTEGPAEGEGTRFYGIRSLSKRIVFVMDVSGSMAEPAGSRGTGAGAAAGKGTERKIDIARRELKAALARLDEKAWFNIVFYEGDVKTFQPGLIKATKANRDAAFKFIDALEPNGGTNIHDALQKGFNFAGEKKVDVNFKEGADTIFFLTDGKPTAGMKLEPQEILDSVKEWNKLRKITIHAIGIGDHDSDFMKRLATENGGQYVGIQ